MKLPKKSHAPTSLSFSHLSNLHLDKQIARLDAVSPGGTAWNGAKITKFGRQQRTGLYLERQARIADGTWGKHQDHCSCAQCRMLRRELPLLVSVVNRIGHGSR